MIRIVNNWIPVHGFTAMTVWPFVFVRKEYVNELKRRGMWDTIMNHERIHGEQQVEMGAVGIFVAALLVAVGCGWWAVAAVPMFFWWYVGEFVVRKIFGHGDAYRKIGFEREAYNNEDDLEYLTDRRPFEWVRWIR